MEQWGLQVSHLLHSWRGHRAHLDSGVGLLQNGCTGEWIVDII